MRRAAMFGGGALTVVEACPDEACIEEAASPVAASLAAASHAAGDGQPSAGPCNLASSPELQYFSFFYRVKINTYSRLAVGV